MAASNATSARKTRSLELQRKALELRRMGKGYREIGAALGIGRSQAHRLVEAGLEDVKEQIDAEASELKAVELSRLDGMLSGLWADARSGNFAAVDRVLRIMERRAKLLGLDAPVKVAQTTKDGEDREDQTQYVVPVPAGMDLQAWLQTFGQSTPPSFTVQ
jgi:hypothetical protein